MTEEAVYCIVSATLPPPLLYPASAVAPYRTKGGKFPPLLHKIFNDDQFFWHVFGRAPCGLQLCIVEFKSVAPLLRYSTCKYTLIQ